MLYSRFFRGPTLGPDSDSSDSCHDGTSHYGAAVEGRTRDDDSGWNSNFNEGAKSGGRTPMAIAKSKLTSASEAVIPLKKALEKVKGEEQKKAKKRKRSDNDEAEVKKQEKEDRKKEDKKKERQDKKEKKKRKRDGKEDFKEEKKREKKSKKDKIEKAPVADKSSSLKSTRSNKGLTQTIEPNEASTALDKTKLIPCSGDEELNNDKNEKKSEKKRKGKDDKFDTSGDKEKRRRERKQKRDRKEAEKQARAVVPQPIGANGEGLSDSNTRSIYSPVKNSEEFRSESKKKKKRKRDE